MGIGGGNETSTSFNIPPELSALFQGSADRMLEMQTANPIFGPSAWAQNQPGGSNYTPPEGGAAQAWYSQPPNQQEPNPRDVNKMAPDEVRTTEGTMQLDDQGYPPQGGHSTRQYVDPSNPGTSGGWAMDPSGVSQWMPGFQQGPTDGGDYGFLGPNARGVAGTSGLHDGAIDLLGQGIDIAQLNRGRAQQGLERAGTTWDAAIDGVNRGRGIAQDFRNVGMNQLNHAADIANHNIGGDPLALQRANEAGGQALWNTQNFLEQGPNAQLGKAAARFGNAPSIGRQRVNPQTLENNEMVAAKKKQFELTSQPMLQNEFSAMGLGRSGGLGAAQSDTWGKESFGVMEDETAREERRIQRALDSTLASAAGAADIGAGIDQRKLGAVQNLNDTSRVNTGLFSELNDRSQFGSEFFRGLGNDKEQWGANAFDQALGRSGMLGDIGNQFMQRAGMQQGFGTDAFNQRRGAAGDMFNYGTHYQDTAQAANDSFYDDFLRRQGLAENAINIPFGAAANTIGTTTSAGK